jgi:endonuclease/exonuclease/phosphatase family metal-dependent hydrolase
MDHIKVFSYNVSWENMVGNKKDKMCIVNNKNICKENIIKNITDDKYDIICLQEIVMDKKEIEEICMKNGYKYVENRSGKEKMITFYNNKMKIIKKYSGSFERGRPWCLILFDNDICVINVHFGHYYGSDEDKKFTIQSYINDIPQIEASTYIIAGDFNHDIRKIKYNRKRLKEGESKITLCGFGNRLCKNKNGKRYDHIMSNKKIVWNKVIKNGKNFDIHASDHLAIYAKIKLK